MRRLPVVAASLVVLSAAAGGCYPNRFDSTDYDVVAAVHDSTADFAGAATYSLNGTVFHLVAPGENDQISRVLDPAILTQIRINMTQAGYTEITGPNADSTADLRVAAAVSSSDYTAYYWDYWCGIYWYGCYYPPYYGSYTYTLGTLFVVMQDRRVPPQAGKRPMVWMGLGNGLLGSGANAAKVTSAIDQMFDLSPYLITN